METTEILIYNAWHLVNKLIAFDKGSFLKNASMGKKRISVIGSENESELKAKKAVKLEQKKLREGKSLKIDEKNVVAQVDSTEETKPEKIEKTAAPITPKIETAKPVKTIRTRSEAYKKAKMQINADHVYPLADGLRLLREVSLTKFDPTVELHIVIKSGTVSQTVDMPYSTGKSRVIAIADDATIKRIETGDIFFQVLLASPSQMPKLVKFAKTLGPKGLMPNPKNGTVVPDPEAVAQKLSSAVSVGLKTDKSAPVIHTIVGKLSQSDKELTANIEAILKAISQPLVKIVLKSTMSPAIKISL